MTKKHHPKNEDRQPNAVGWQLQIPSWVSWLTICAIGIAAYSNTFFSSFHFDDETSIVNNPAIRDLSNLRGIFYYSATRFVTYLSFALNYRVGGLDVFGYHLVNLAIHLAAALMVWLLARQVLRSPAFRETEPGRAASILPLFAALIFVLHPVQTQAVTYIAQRAASLAALFYLLSLYLYGQARTSQLAGKGKTATAGLLLGALIAGLVGVFSKETALTLPFAIILYEVLFYREKGKTRWGFITAIIVVVAFVPLFLVSQRIVASAVEGALPWGEYLLTQPRVWLTYLGLFALPVGQNLDYDFVISRSLFELPTLLSVAVLALIAFIGFKLFRTERALSFGIFWFFLTLLPESSILPLPDLIFEHRLYLPMVGLSLFSAFLLYELTKRWNPRALVALLVAVIGLFGLATYERNKVWMDDVALWSDVVKKSPKKARGYLNLGRAYSDRGLFNLANDNFARALAINPSYADVYGNRANVLVRQGQPDAAIAECNRALAFGGGLGYQLARIYFNRGTGYLMKNRIDSALVDLNKAIQHDANHPPAYFNRGIVYSLRGEPQKAIDDYTRSLALDPRYAKALNNRGVIYKDRGELDEAMVDFNNSIIAQADYAQPYFNRAQVLSLRGKLDQAISDFSTFISFSPNNPDGYHNRGVIYHRMKEYDKAISDFDRALSLNPSLGPAFVDRAQALLATRQFAAADSDLKRARALGVQVDPELLMAAKKGM